MTQPDGGVGSLFPHRGGLAHEGRDLKKVGSGGPKAAVRDRVSPPARLSDHSDPGSQYASREFQDLPCRHGIACAGRGDWPRWEGSCFGSQKQELAYRQKYRSRW